MRSSSQENLTAAQQAINAEVNRGHVSMSHMPLLVHIIRVFAFLTVTDKMISSFQTSVLRIEIEHLTVTEQNDVPLKA